mmetsp:Transcript_43172/g.137873  ORF Transcript_43172/g.137873 Transcript_43172/m.137873 type:complete len:232 (+) Transcript_43172:213-908(+)
MYGSPSPCAARTRAARTASASPPPEPARSWETRAPITTRGPGEDLRGRRDSLLFASVGSSTSASSKYSSTTSRALSALRLVRRSARTARTLENTCRAVRRRKDAQRRGTESEVALVSPIPTTIPTRVVTVSWLPSLDAMSAELPLRAKCCVSAMRLAPAATPVSAWQMLPRHARSMKSSGTTGAARWRRRPTLLAQSANRRHCLARASKEDPCRRAKDTPASIPLTSRRNH